MAAASDAAGATGDGTGGADQPNPLMQMLPMILLFIGVFYFFMIRPQQKREKERREMLNSISKGDEVITNGGIYGTVVGLKEKTVVLRVSEDPPIKMQFVRGAVSRVNSSDDESDE
ncbi:MAG: preprotein translocase subunit YajC [bacterium]|nr:preprotein translocase subunit YajC [bacterium]